MCDYDIDLLVHFYNATWMNERAVEVPLGLKVLEEHRGTSVLEVGNVLRHYRSELMHGIVDKYESGAGILNVDAREFRPIQRFSLILSLSTLEHVGWDETPRDPEKAAATIAHLRTLLEPEGTLFITVPAGYHPALDNWLLSHPAGLKKLCGIRRGKLPSDWEECEASQLAGVKFGKPSPFANGLFVAWFGVAG